MPVMSISLVGLLAGIGVGRRRVAAVVAEALSRAKLTQDYAARAAEIRSLSKFSEQLNGKLPLTALGHLLESDELFEQTDLWHELAAVMADQVGCSLVSRDLGTLVDRLTWFLSVTPKPMAKAQLPTGTRTVVLPLGSEQKAQRQ